MGDAALIKLAQDLEWLGSEANFYSKKSSEAASDIFLQRQHQVLATADKIERELKGAVRFNITTLVGFDYPMELALDSITALLTALEGVKHSAVHSVTELPSMARKFSRMVDNYVSASLPMTA
jgi:hypothetical protein